MLYKHHKFEWYLTRTLVYCYMNHICSILNTLFQYGILNHHMPVIVRLTAKSIWKETRLKLFSNLDCSHPPFFPYDRRDLALLAAAIRKKKKRECGQCISKFIIKKNVNILSASPPPPSPSSPSPSFACFLVFPRLWLLLSYEPQTKNPSANRLLSFVVKKVCWWTVNTS